jgi:hypothetical protein
MRGKDAVGQIDFQTDCPNLFTSRAVSLAHEAAQLVFDVDRIIVPFVEKRGHDVFSRISFKAMAFLYSRARIAVPVRFAYII